MQKLIAACLLLAPLAAVRPRATAPVPLKLRGGADATPPQPPQPPPPPQRRRPPREAVAARLLATGSGRRAALTGFEMLDLLDTYAPPLACASRYGWQRLCADVLAPYWVAGADRRDVRRAFQRRAADPRSQEFQARHRYYGLAPAEADAFLDRPFDKYASVSDAFLRREGLGRYAAAAASSKDVDSIFGGKALKAERGSLRRAAMRRDAGDDGAAWDEDEDEDEDEDDEDADGDAAEEEGSDAADESDEDEDEAYDGEDEDSEEAVDEDDEDTAAEDEDEELDDVEEDDEDDDDDDECDHYDDDDEDEEDDDECDHYDDDEDLEDDDEDYDDEEYDEDDDEEYDDEDEDEYDEDEDDEDDEDEYDDEEEDEYEDEDESEDDDW